MQGLMRRTTACLAGVILLAGSAWASLLDGPPIASGGDPTGRWGGGEIPVDVYSDPLLLAGVDDLSMAILASGQVEFEPGGIYSLAYTLRIDISMTVLGAPLQVSVRDTVEEAGSYEVAGSQLRLSTGSSVDTLSFTAAEDFLTVIRPVPLGDLAALALSVAPGADLPIAAIHLSRQFDSGLSADFNDDGRVDFADFLNFADGFGARVGETRFDARFDFDGDDMIGFVDFLEFASQFRS